MKFSTVIALFSVGLATVFAAPNPTPSKSKSKSSKKSPPGPPDVMLNSAFQSCGNSNSLSSLRCCTDSSKNSKKASSRSKVKHKGDEFDLDCDAIIIDGSDKKKSVVQVCSVTVACCIGANCTAIAG